jgi:hypothetical protein
MFEPSEQETLPSFYTQVREELVRQINEAQRWSAVEDAAMALIKVRRMAEQHQNEQRHIRNMPVRAMGDSSATLKKREASVA